MEKYLKKLTRIKHRVSKRKKIKNSRDMEDKVKRSTIHLSKENIKNKRDTLFKEFISIMCFTAISCEFI